MFSALSLWLIMQAPAEPSVADARREAIVLMNSGVDAYAAGDLEQAERSLREAAALDPAYDAPHINLARLHFALERFTDAELAYERAIQLASADQRAQLHHEHGLVVEAMAESPKLSALERRGQLGRAAQIFGLAVSADPRDYRSHHRRAVIHDQLDDFQAADASWRSCIEIQPGHAPCFVGLAHMYIDFGADNVAIAVLDVGTMLNDTDAQMWLGAAEGYLEVELWQQAADAARTATTIDPDLADAYFLRGMAAVELRDRKLAVEQLSIYSQRVPARPPFEQRQIEAAQTLEQLRAP
jgi:Tfp pilus assembly protein PilF